MQLFLHPTVDPLGVPLIRSKHAHTLVEFTNVQFHVISVIDYFDEW